MSCLMYPGQLDPSAINTFSLGSENAVSLFRDGNGKFEFTIVMYHPDNGQRIDKFFKQEMLHLQIMKVFMQGEATNHKLSMQIE